jgi:MFS family permease
MISGCSSIPVLHHSDPARRNVVVTRRLRLGARTMNIAVAITALFSGIFIVVIGGLADHDGRVRIVQSGFHLGILGSLLVGLAPVGRLASPFLLTGRALQGLSDACIMPASLALVKTYWDGAARQRAVSLWSIGSRGGSGVCALFGGLVALCGLALTRGTPEGRAEVRGTYHFDFAGVITFMIAMVALQVVVTQGNKLGWTSPAALILIAVALVAGFLLFFASRHEIPPPSSISRTPGGIATDSRRSAVGCPSAGWSAVAYRGATHYKQCGPIVCLVWFLTSRPGFAYYGVPKIVR